MEPLSTPGQARIRKPCPYVDKSGFNSLWRKSPPAKRPEKTRQNWSMYLLLCAHPSGAVLQELTQAGHSHPANPEPRLVSGSELADVVLRLERRPRAGQPPRWIWHRTQDWYPSLLAR